MEQPVPIEDLISLIEEGTSIVLANNQPCFTLKAPLDECLAIQETLLENEWQLARLPNSPVIRIKFTFFDESTNPYRSECFFNVASQEDKEILQVLTELPYFNIGCFDMENQFVWGRRYNHRELQRRELQQLIEKAEQHLETIPQSVRDFDSAKQEFMRRYPLSA